MAIPERLVEVWAAGADGRGESGSGWIVGHSGVLSCRHVFNRYLAAVEDNANVSIGAAGQTRIQVRRASASSAQAWVDCVIVWQHPARDLVLLKISPQSDQAWESPKGRPSRLTGTGEHPSKSVAMGFPDAVVRPTGLRDSEQVTGWLMPAGAARDPDGLIPFDVDGSVPDSAALWKGFSGSALVDQRTRLVGLVVKAHPERQRRHLLVVPVEDAASDPAFTAAAVAVGLDPTVEDFWAPVWRESVEPRALTAAGVPSAVADIEDLKVLGVHGSSSASALGSPVGYLRRDKDAELGEALARARSGGQRVVLIVGDSAAGKSRSGAEALRRDRVLRSWRLVVPLSDGGLSRLADAGLGWQGTVLWLDDLDKYLARLDLGTLRRILSDDPTVMVVATMRASQLQGRQGQLADPAWAFLTDDSEVQRVDLEASLNDDELQDAAATISDPALLNALYEGIGLGEWFVAGPELMKKLNDESDPLNRAFVDTIIAWYRTGLDMPLPSEDARRLWTDALSSPLRQRLLSREPEERGELFAQAARWASKPVFSRALYEQALVTRAGGGYVAHDYVVDQIARNSHRRAVPDAVWGHALQVAMDTPESDQRPSLIWAVGTAAYQERVLAHCLVGMRILADEGDVYALLNTAVLLGELDRPEAEIGVFEEVVDRFGQAAEPAVREQVAIALLNKGIVSGRLGQPEAEVTAYNELVDRFGQAAEPATRELVATALVNKGVALIELGWSEEAVGVYDDMVARFGEDAEPAVRGQVAKAMVNRGVIISQLGDLDAGITAYDEVVAQFGEDAEPAVREHVAKAMVNKGVVLAQLGRPETVGIFDQVVARFGEDATSAVREAAARALYNKGFELGQQGQPEAEVTAYDEVVARFGEDAEPAVRKQVARTLVNKGFRLVELGRPEEAIGAYDEIAVRFGEDAEPAVRELVATALVNKGFRLVGLERPEEAVAAYDEIAVRFGEDAELAVRELVATALVKKGITLVELGRPEEAIGAYDEVVARFGEDAEPAVREQTARALYNKGFELAQVGQPEAEVTAYDEVVVRFGEDAEPAVRELVAMALVNKGFRLVGLGRPEEAVAAYDEVVARFGEDDESTVREKVATALRLKARIGS